MSPRLEGKVCVITGAGGRIGHTSDLAFAREGALVAVCDLNIDAAQSAIGLVKGLVARGA
jgi:NAD(P)-dependent dehydrogenase (short-subunit alcohol dehydrogenase family)